MQLAPCIRYVTEILQFVIWQNTLRWPTSNSSADAQSQENLVRQYMDSFQAQARDTLYILLTQYNTFNNFSNEAWQRENNVQGYASIEGLHDNVHSAVGGQNWGHMSVIDVSAFDPMFWLHHWWVVAS